LPLIGWFVATYLLNLSDRILIQLFKGSAEVGIYSPSYSFVMGIFGLITAPLSYASHALIMKEAGKKDVQKETLQAVIKEFSRIYILISMPIFFFSSLFAKEIAGCFLGAEFQEGYVVIPIVLFGYLAWNFSMFGQKGLEISEKTKNMLYFVMVCTALNISLNIIFIPWMGYVGAAITSLVSLSLYPILIYIGTRKYMAWLIPWDSLLRAFISSSLMSVPLLALRASISIDVPLVKLAITLPTGAITYLASLFLVGEMKGTRCVFSRS